MLAHELRNPLAPISAAADLLKIGRLDEHARVRQSSAIIGRQVRHMTSLVDDLLDVSRVTRGLVTLARAPVDGAHHRRRGDRAGAPAVRGAPPAPAVRCRSGRRRVWATRRAWCRCWPTC
jgi:signal transduction histidine kinase